MNEVLSCLPQNLRQRLQMLSKDIKNKLEEIRIRVERPVELLVQNQSYFLCVNGTVTTNCRNGVIVTREDGDKIMNLISRHSVYALEEELRRGYITLSGGHRIGIAGKAVTERGKIKMLRDIRSFNFRIAKAQIGVATRILPSLLDCNGRILNTLIISPPRCGKTTLLRDLARLLSTGDHQFGVGDHRVAIVDERSEIAGCLDGIPQHDLGPRVDVLDHCPKAEGTMMLIRSMSPDVILTDEIGKSEDTQAIKEAMHAGVNIITTVHGSDLSDIEQRPSLLPLFHSETFERFVQLSARQGVGTVEGVFDRNKNRVHVPARYAQLASRNEVRVHA